MKTQHAKKGEVERHWYLVDAKDQVLGRMVSRVASLLRGKTKPDFTPHVVCWDMFTPTTIYYYTRHINGAVYGVGGGDGSPYYLQFDGSNDYVDIGTPDVSGETMSLALWFRADAFGIQDARLISKAFGTAESHHYWMLSTILVDGQYRLRARLKVDGLTKTYIPANALSTEVWTHVAMVYDGSELRLYLDGVEVLKKHDPQLRNNRVGMLQNLSSLLTKTVRVASQNLFATVEYGYLTLD